MKTELKNIANIQTGVFAKPVAKGDIAYLQPKYFDETGKLTVNLEPDLNSIGISEKHILKQGDVIFAAKGSKNFAARFDLEDVSAAASTSFFVIRIFNKNILPEYLTWYLNHQTTMKYLKSFARGTSIASISKEVLNNLEIIIPSIEMQQLIFKVDDLRSSERRIIMKLLSLKQALNQQQLYNALT
ncbi:restriction endonuclease subunit S [uncultured Maribacter sp.]|uniref:restriction endonuclease subunit S n=1 Tax=uncultured Maribacter sp. TaxID=431308 RepID=UPI00261FBFC3|nr:restriction endonuclease subunit S [uncultured Maribacter sp.]